MIDPADLAHCRETIRTGSLSFHAASRLLPAKVRDPALALYAFCRLADDQVDEGDHKTRAVLRLQERLDLAYAGRPEDTPEDRAFAGIVEEYEMPRALPEALLEGLAWDARGDRYATLSQVRAYSARVAAAVGAMMCVLMGERDADVLARACDLGVAMQLTNIARDVGEDARAGRIYLPLDWFAEAGIDAETFLYEPLPTEPIRRMVSRLLAEARRLYIRSEPGINALPLEARTGIWAARLIYAGIGAEIRRNGHDSVTLRAHTSTLQKAGWMTQSAARAVTGALMPRSAVVYAPPLAEVAFLIDAAGRRAERGAWGDGRTGSVLAVLAELRGRDGLGREGQGA